MSTQALVTMANTTTTMTSATEHYNYAPVAKTKHIFKPLMSQQSSADIFVHNQTPATPHLSSNHLSDCGAITVNGQEELCQHLVTTSQSMVSGLFVWTYNQQLAG